MLSPTIIFPINLHLQVSSGLHFSLSPPKICQWINNNQIFPQSDFVPMHDPWVGKSPWRRKWQLTPVFLPGEFHGQGSLVGLSPWGHKESDTTEWLTHTHNKHYSQWWKTESILFKFSNETWCPLSSLLFYIVLEVLFTTIREEKRNKRNPDQKI